MKKKLIILTMSILLMFSLIGCGSTMLSEEDLSNTNKSEYSMFIELEKGSTYMIVYHKDTKVMYAISLGYYNNGTFTVMMNADGSPMVYEGK